MVKASFLKLAAAALLLGLTLSSCGSSDGSVVDGYKEISIENAGYDLYVPEEWIVDSQTAYTSAHRSDRDPSNISVMAHNLTVDTNYASYGDYWKSNCEQQLKQMYPDIEYIKEGTPYTLAMNQNQDAAEYVYTVTASHGIDPDGKEVTVKYKIQQILVKRDATIYSLTYTATEEMFDEAIEEVTAIWNNVVFH